MAEFGKSNKLAFLIFMLFIGMCLTTPAFSETSDFDLSDSTIDLDDIISGGLAKDGIPAISNPKFIEVGESNEISDNDLVIGLSLKGGVRAYPTNILNWHEIVNDAVNGEPVAVTWCPLTKSAVVFSRTIDGETLEFGVSGLLYNSNLLMYDRDSLSLWPQLGMTGVTGKFAGRKLKVVPSILTAWKEWKAVHPDTLVLSQDTGFKRDYDVDPYDLYHLSPGVVFPVENIDERLPAKELAIGLRLRGVAKAYPIEAVQRKNTSLEDDIAGEMIKIHPGPSNTAYITDDKGNLLPAVIVYWFGWSAFNEDTLIYEK